MKELTTKSYEEKLAQGKKPCPSCVRKKKSSAGKTTDWALIQGKGKK